MSDEKTIIAENINATVLKAASRKKACLVQYSGSKTGRRYPIGEAITVIGRKPEVQISIAEPSVSREHARLIQHNDRMEVEDLGSSNGTFVNDVKVGQKTTLKDGDLLRLGTIVLKYYAHENIESMMADKIYRMATIDAGTQIFNKQYLLDTLEFEFRFSKTANYPLSIIYYDLDFFKKVNDTYGHNAGDFILKESAAVVKSMIRKDDILGRFGGEEFVIVLPKTDQKTAADLAERIRALVEAHVFNFEVETPKGRNPVNHKQTISMGVSQISPAMTTQNELLEAADKKLYQSKQTGRNKVTT